MKGKEGGRVVGEEERMRGKEREGEVNCDYISKQESMSSETV